MRKFFRFDTIFTFLILTFIFLGMAVAVIFPPRPIVKSVVIERGMNAEDIAKKLKEAHIIRSKTLFVWMAQAGGVEGKLGAGRFLFDRPLSLFEVLERLSGERKEILVVIPEGSALKDIGDIIEKNGLLSASHFMAAANTEGDLEGFLFPDTYRFFELAAPEEIINTMRENFVEKINPLDGDIARSGRSLHNIVTMASILEKEVQTEADKAIVAGILWRRFREDIPLQVDATLRYRTGRGSKDLTAEDLASSDPYNTYRYKGLPPGPISNPGLESLKAALYSTSTPYYYYLTDKNGTVHYARTFDEHKVNKARYIE